MMYVGVPFSKQLFSKATLIKHTVTSIGCLNSQHPGRKEYRDCEKPLILENGDSIAIRDGEFDGVEMYSIYAAVE